MSIYIFEYVHDLLCVYSAKEQLLAVIEMIYRYVPRDESLMEDAISAIVADYLKLPEGKLVSGKAKKKVMKWADQLTARANARDAGGAVETVSSAACHWMVADISGTSLSLMQTDVESEDVLEDIEVRDAALLAKIIAHFDDEGGVFVALDEGQYVTGAFSHTQEPL